MINDSSISLALSITEVAYQLQQFSDYIHSLDPELTEIESNYLTAAVLHNLPDLFQLTPELIQNIKKNAAFIRSKRCQEY